MKQELSSFSMKQKNDREQMAVEEDEKLWFQVKKIQKEKEKEKERGGEEEKGSTSTLTLTSITSNARSASLAAQASYAAATAESATQRRIADSLQLQVSI